MPMIAEEQNYGVLVPEEYGYTDEEAYMDYGQVLSIEDVPTRRTGEYGQADAITIVQDEPIVGTVDPASWGRYGQMEIVGTVDQPIVGTTDPASWGQYLPYTRKRRRKMMERRRRQARKTMKRLKAAADRAYARAARTPWPAKGRHLRAAGMLANRLMAMRYAMYGRRAKQYYAPEGVLFPRVVGTYMLRPPGTARSPRG